MISEMLDNSRQTRTIFFNVLLRCLEGFKGMEFKKGN